MLLVRFDFMTDLKHSTSFRPTLRIRYAAENARSANAPFRPPSGGRLPVALYMAGDSIMQTFLPSSRVWTADRDARLYSGGSPVVAAPPCAGYSRMRHLALSDPVRDSCAPVALRQVRSFGGVLEHPRHSRLFSDFGLPVAGGLDFDEFGGWVLECRQFDFGHPAIKWTWLYIVGVSPSDVFPLLPPRRAGSGLLLFWHAKPARCVVGQKLPNGQYYRAGMFAPDDAFAKYWRSSYPAKFAEFLLGIASIAIPPVSPPSRL